MLEVVIKNRQDMEPAAEFSLHFESIPFDPQAQKKFLEKLITVFGDDDFSFIHVKSYSYSNRHVLFKWVNTTSPQNEVKTFNNILFFNYSLEKLLGSGIYKVFKI